MRASVSSAVLIWTLAHVSGRAHAEPNPAAVNIWYRSADGCPDGDAFVERLATRKVDAKLATAADPIDFVVTLGATGSGFSGRLERQTHGGTVAIRSFEARSCEQVADALALTLALAFEPTPARDAVPEQPESEPEPTPSRAEPARVSALPPPDPLTDVPPDTRSPPANGYWSAGAAGFALSGVAPQWMPALGVFFERTVGGGGLLSPAFRVTALVGRASSEGSGGELEVVLLAGRVEGCPLRWATGALTLRPCAGLDAGIFSADFSGAGGRAATAAWLALTLHPRLGWKLSSALELEAQAGILVPITHHEVVLANDSASLHETAAVGLQAGLGLAYRWP